MIATHESKRDVVVVFQESSRHVNTSTRARACGLIDQEHVGVSQRHCDTGGDTKTRRLVTSELPPSSLILSARTASPNSE